jgi:hypothetical protein
MLFITGNRSNNLQMETNERGAKGSDLLSSTATAYQPRHWWACGYSVGEGRTVLAADLGGRIAST